VKSEDLREYVDIKVLNAEINELVAKQAELREKIDKIVSELEAAN
jgi:type I restriction enzyme M protein